MVTKKELCNLKTEITPFIKGELVLDQNLAKFTSWHVGGSGDLVFWPKSLQDLQAFFKYLAKNSFPKCPITFLGLGSNVLIRDGGLRGITIITQGGLNKLELLNNNTIYAEAGVPCPKVAKFMAKACLTNGEFLSGIPGTIGGALAMNAGAYGGETWDYVKEVAMLQSDGEILTRTPKEFTVNYRHISHPNFANEYFVSAKFAFALGDAKVSLNNIKQLLKSRNASQPIGQFSGGSVFRNPKDNYAAKLIENLGLKKYTIGGAKISEKHANFIINDKTATASEIENLINYTKEQVYKNNGIDLIPEVHIIGENK